MPAIALVFSAAAALAGSPNYPQGLPIKNPAPVDDFVGFLYELPPNTYQLPDFRSLRPRRVIRVQALDFPDRPNLQGFPTLPGRNDWFAIDFFGVFNVAQADEYGFQLTSDDGSRLYIDNQRVIDNDGGHGMVAKNSRIRLGPGQHRIEVQYFQAWGGAGLQLVCGRGQQQWLRFPDCGLTMVPFDVITGEPVGTDATASGGAPKPSTAPAAPGDGPPVDPAKSERVADAPQAILHRYARQRLAGAQMPLNGRDSVFLTQYMAQLDLGSGRDLSDNEIKRQRAQQDFLDRLQHEPDDDRVVLGMYVQLKDYDLTSKSFRVRYPEFFPGGKFDFSSSIFAGQSQLAAPEPGYTSSRSICVWDPGSDYARPDLSDGWFVVMANCVQHPATGRLPFVLDGNINELPVFFQLKAHRGRLWTLLPMGENDASDLIDRLPADRKVWAEVVFDIQSLTAGAATSFRASEVYQQKQPGAVIEANPQAMFLWEPPRNGRRGRYITAVGNVAAAHGNYDGVLKSEVAPAAATPQPVERPSTPPPGPAPAPPGSEGWVLPPSRK